MNKTTRERLSAMAKGRRSLSQIPETPEQTAERYRKARAANPVISLSVQRRLKAMGLPFIESEFGSPTNPAPSTRCDSKEQHPPHDETDDWH